MTASRLWAIISSASLFPAGKRLRQWKLMSFSLPFENWDLPISISLSGKRSCIKRSKEQKSNQTLGKTTGWKSSLMRKRSRFSTNLHPALWLNLLFISIWMTLCPHSAMSIMPVWKWFMQSSFEQQHARTGRNAIMQSTETKMNQSGCTLNIFHRMVIEEINNFTFFDFLVVDLN